MRSARGLVSAVIMLLALPAAIAASALGDDAAGVVIHLALGASCVFLALAIADFGLPRWLNGIGVVGAAGVGAIFLLQAVSIVIPDDGLYRVAFTILGQEPERWFPNAVFVWFAGLLLAGTSGRTRLFGWAAMPLVIGTQLAIVIGLVFGIEVQNLKVLMLLPFIWLLLESLKSNRASSFVPSRMARVSTAS